MDEPGQDPTGELPPGFDGADPAELEALAAAGFGEGDFDGDHAVPAELVELFEVLEWQRAGGE